LVEFNSLTIGILALLPTLVSAIIVEKHYTKFWIAVWNAFALFLTGMALKVAPATPIPVFIEMGGTIELWWVLILYGLGALFLGFKVRSGVLRTMCGSKVTSGFLVTALVLQYFAIHDFGTVAFIFVATVLGTWFASHIAP
jgi:hypothetical protein